MSIRNGGAALLLTLSILLVLAGPATAKPAKTDLVVYSSLEAFDGFLIATGQLHSPEAKCTSGRDYKLVSKKGRKTKLLDDGTATKDGSLAGLGAERFGTGKRKLYLKLRGTRACRPAMERVPLPRTKGPMRASIGTIPLPRGISGKGDEGVIAGIVALDRRSRHCFSSRPTKLTGSQSGLVDRGVTSHNGVWALHVTVDELEDNDDFLVEVGPSIDGDDTCLSGDVIFDPDE